MLFFDYIENAISLVKKVFPDHFSYITFAHHCFDPTSNDVACNTPSSQRGIPKNLDWIGFDWYLYLYIIFNNLIIIVSHN